MILILSNKWDLTVDFVVQELRNRKHDFLRINTEDLVAEKVNVTLPDLHIFTTKHQTQSYDLTRDVRVIWNRRPGKPFDDVPLDKRPSLATQRFINDQWYSWLECLQLLPHVTWINHPDKNSQMESKIRQLWLASKIGFSIPKTIITNDPDAARTHLEKLNSNIIAKALYSPLIEEPEQDYFIFTSRVSKIEPQDDETIKLSPSIFQEMIFPKIDYRVTVVGEKVFPVIIKPDENLKPDIDWRTQKDGLKFSLCTLPDDIEGSCRSYVKQNGLLFGAIDLVKRNDEWIFLEINPNGEWGWLQKPHGIPIAETLCDLMIKEDTK